METGGGVHVFIGRGTANSRVNDSVYRIRNESPPLAESERVRAEWRPENCGLINLGNTCYMNSVLQCLLHTTELSHLFLRDFYKIGVAREGPLAVAFKHLVDQTHSHYHTVASGHVINPEDFKTAICVFNREFEGRQQQDSQELLSSVLLGIHQGLNKRNGAHGDGTADGALAGTVWAHDSCIKDTFQGLFRNRVTCNVCHRTSVKFDPFDILQLHFKQQDAAYIHLADMLQAEIAEEQMAGPTAYTR